MTPTILASCATVPPNGEPCIDTVVVVGPTPLWLPFVILALVAVVGIVVVAVLRQRRR